MSFGPRIVVGAGMYGAGAASKGGYMNGSEGATPLYHVGIFSRACLITTQIMLFYTLINTGFEHFLCNNQPN